MEPTEKSIHLSKSHLEIIKTLEVPLTGKKIDPEELKKCSYIIIRHGFSKANSKCKVEEKLNGKDSKLSQKYVVDK